MSRVEICFTFKSIGEQGLNLTRHLKPRWLLLAGFRKMSLGQFHTLKSGLNSQPLCFCVNVQNILHVNCKTTSWKLKKNVNENTNINSHSQNLTLQFATWSAFVPLEVYKGMFESVKLDNPFSGDAASTGSA